MSDTTEQQPVPEATEGAPAPSDAATEQTTPPEQETPPAAPPEEAQKERESRLDRRITGLRIQLTNSERARQETAQEVEALKAQIRAMLPQPPPPDPQHQAAVRAEAQQISAAERFAEKKEAFHAAGREAFPDWEQRMSELQGLGAVPISSLFLELPNGHRVAAALRDNPEALQEIMAHSTQDARAVALGKYVQQLSATPTRNVSRAPPPPKPIQGRVATAFDPYAANVPTNRLVEFFSKQAMDKQLEMRRNGGQR